MKKAKIINGNGEFLPLEKALINAIFHNKPGVITEDGTTISVPAGQSGTDHQRETYARMKAKEILNG